MATDIKPLKPHLVYLAPACSIYEEPTPGTTIETKLAEGWITALHGDSAANTMPYIVIKRGEGNFSTIARFKHLDDCLDFCMSYVAATTGHTLAALMGEVAE